MILSIEVKNNFNIYIIIQTEKFIINPPPQNYTRLGIYINGECFYRSAVKSKEMCRFHLGSLDSAAGHLVTLLKLF